MFPPSIPASSLFLPSSLASGNGNGPCGCCATKPAEHSDAKSSTSNNSNVDDDDDDDDDKFHGTAVDWFESVYPTLIDRATELGMYEFIQEAGDTVFVPYDWWHIVLNLPTATSLPDHVIDHKTPSAASPSTSPSSSPSPSIKRLEDISIAVTQNYLSWHHYPVILKRYYDACNDGALQWFNALPTELQSYVADSCSFLTKSNLPISLSSNTPSGNDVHDGTPGHHS
jgi:hypothetical protein